MDIWVYRISEDDAFPVTTDPDDQYLNDVFGDMVAYVDMRGGVSEDVYITRLEFVPPNQPPVADAGPDQPIILLNTEVQLDGSGSYDADGDPIEYAWHMLQRPTGSVATLSDPDIVNPAFIADVRGTYVIELTVSGPCGANTDTVEASFTNLPPVADAGDVQLVTVGETVWLDGSGSSDPNGDPLSYNWALIVPAGSTAVLSSTNGVQPNFVADVAGIYEVSLVVSDGFVNSPPDTVSIAASTIGDQIPGKIGEILAIIIGMDPGVLKNPNMQEVLADKLAEVAAKVTDGDYEGALNKLQNDVLKRTDGCAVAGAPDKNDWIRECNEQALIYPLVLEVIDLLEQLIP